MSSLLNQNVVYARVLPTFTGETEMHQYVCHVCSIHHPWHGRPIRPRQIGDDFALSGVEENRRKAGVRVDRHHPQPHTLVVRQRPVGASLGFGRIVAPKIHIEVPNMLADLVWSG